MKSIADTCFLPLLLMLSIVSSFRSMMPIRTGRLNSLSKTTFSSRFSQVKDKATVHHSGNNKFKPKVLFILGGPGAGKGK